MNYRRTNREKVSEYLHKKAVSNHPEVTSIDVSRECQLKSPHCASSLLREFVGSDQGICLTIKNERKHRSRVNVYHILIVTGVVNGE